MPDKKGNLYLYEAIELRSEYDRHVELLESLFGGVSTKKRPIFHADDEDKDKEPAADFNQKEIEGKQALFVLNLEPKKMMGQISEGMLFDIGYTDGIKAVLAVPERPVPNGVRAG